VLYICFIDLCSLVKIGKLLETFEEEPQKLLKHGYAKAAGAKDYDFTVSSGSARTKTILVFSDPFNH